ncbi:hypothetical protein BGW80DRAFT_1521649 [Lactifluus volemus]|nr:hypothetical protein BGW80DRAFT_1521649 [Lactifluus volemus]
MTELPHFILIAPPPPEATPKESLVKAWTHAITALPPTLQTHFTVLEGRLSTLPPDQLRCDLIVSPANSFGIMDGGYDLVLSLALEGADGFWTLSRHVQRAMHARWHGYIPPGSCLITSLPSTVAGGNENQFGASSIAIVPTMRYPGDVRWHQDLVYNAVWSLLVEVNRWNADIMGHGAGKTDHKIERILMTGLATAMEDGARCVVPSR